MSRVIKIRAPHPLNPHAWDRIEIRTEAGELLRVEIVEREANEDAQDDSAAEPPVAA